MRVAPPRRDSVRAAFTRMLSRKCGVQNQWASFLTAVGMRAAKRSAHKKNEFSRVEKAL
jgi:hypothetical protein